MGIATAINPDWTLTQGVSPNVHTIDWSVESIKQELWVQWHSDEHWDNPHCDRDLLMSHHDQAQEINAPIIKIGDTFCAMQGKWDRRQSKDDIRPEHQHGDYLDRLVGTAVDWYEPYKEQIAVVGEGNHETAIRKHHETDLISRLTERLQDRGGIAKKGAYGGWVLFRGSMHGRRATFRVKYHHGFGGGGPVTKGAIDFNRMAEQVSQTDAMICGHIHRDMTIRGMREEICGTEVIAKEFHSVRLATYKEEFGDGGNGYHNENNRGPRPLGGKWMRLRFVKELKKNRSKGKRLCLKASFYDVD